MCLVFVDFYSFANSEICKEKMSSLLYRILSRTFTLLLSTLHCRVTNLNRGPVSHATYERLGLTEPILSIPSSFLLEYSLLKNREKVEIRDKLIKERMKNKHTEKKICKVKGVSDSAYNRFCFCFF